MHAFLLAWNQLGSGCRRIQAFEGPICPATRLPRPSPGFAAPATPLDTEPTLSSGKSLPETLLPAARAAAHGTCSARRLLRPAAHPLQTKSELTESLLWMRRIASASSGAMERN